MMERQGGIMRVMDYFKPVWTWTVQKVRDFVDSTHRILNSAAAALRPAHP